MVFDHRDLRTHYLNIVAREILRAMKAEPQTTEALFDHLQEQLQVNLDDQAKSAITPILHQLAALNLIEKTR